MMVALNSSDRKKLISLLASLPEMRDERSRRQFLININAGLGKIADRLDLSGAPSTVAGEIIEVLSNDRESFASLLSTVRELVGAEHQRFLDRLLERSPFSKEEIDVLVREVRQKLEPDIRQRCGTMQVLDMTQPVGLGQIYTDVNVLAKITARQRMNLKELQALCVAKEAGDRFAFGETKQERVPGLEAANAHAKLMVWGKPGAGKTTFLKHLAMQCLDGGFSGRSRAHLHHAKTLCRNRKNAQTPQLPRSTVRRSENRSGRCRDVARNATGVATAGRTG